MANDPNDLIVLKQLIFGNSLSEKMTSVILILSKFWGSYKLNKVDSQTKLLQCQMVKAGNWIKELDLLNWMKS